MMIDTTQGGMNDRIVGGVVIVIYRLKTIFANQFRAGRQAKSQLLAKGLLAPVRRCRGGRRRLSVQNAIKREACYRVKSREPLISKRKTIPRVEVRSAHVLRADIGLKIGLGLVSGVNVSTQGKAFREIMRERRREAQVFVVRAHIEELVKASDRNQTKVGP